MADGERNAAWVRAQGVRLSEIAPALHRGRIELFFVQLPARLPPELRVPAVRHIAQLPARVHRPAAQRRRRGRLCRLGLTVRRVATARSAEELARVAVRAAREVLAIDAAWLGRREAGTWQIVEHAGLSEAAGSLVAPDEAIDGVEALLSGETLVSRT